MRARRKKRIAGTSRQGGVWSFELTLVPSREDSRRYASESVREIDRHEALEALRTCSLAAAVLPDNLHLAREERDGVGKASAAARISFVRLALWQVVSMFDVIRGRDAGVLKLYSDLEEGDFGLIRDRARAR
jgi:hypothetical protein